MVFLNHTELRCTVNHTSDLLWSSSPYDGQRNCPKHVEFYSKNKFKKLVHLVGFIIRIHIDSLCFHRTVPNLRLFFYIIYRTTNIIKWSQNRTRNEYIPTLIRTFYTSWMRFQYTHSVSKKFVSYCLRHSFPESIEMWCWIKMEKISRTDRLRKDY